MKIKQKTRQIRRDFYAIYICEHCGHEEEFSGYDDSYFHNNVIPNMACNKCGKTSEGKSYSGPKYDDSQVI